MGKGREAGRARSWARDLKALERASGLVVVESEVEATWQVPLSDVPLDLIERGSWSPPTSAVRVEGERLLQLELALDAIGRARSLPDLASEGLAPLRRWRHVDLTLLRNEARAHARRLRWALDHCAGAHDMDAARPIGVIVANASTFHPAGEPGSGELRSRAPWPRGMRPTRLLSSVAEAGLAALPSPGPLPFHGLSDDLAIADRLLDVAGPDVARRWLLLVARAWPSEEVQAITIDLTALARSLPDESVLDSILARAAQMRRIPGASSAADRLQDRLRVEPALAVLTPMFYEPGKRMVGQQSARGDRARVAVSRWHLDSDCPDIGWTAKTEDILDSMRGDPRSGKLLRRQVRQLVDLWARTPDRRPRLATFLAAPELPIGEFGPWEVDWPDEVLLTNDIRWRGAVWPAIVRLLDRWDRWDWRYSSAEFAPPSWVSSLPSDLAISVLEAWPIAVPSDGWGHSALRAYLRAIRTIEQEPPDPWRDWVREQWVVELVNGPYTTAVVAMLDRARSLRTGVENTLRAFASLVVLTEGVADVQQVLRTWARPVTSVTSTELSHWSEATGLPPDRIEAYLHYRRLAGDGERLPRAASRLVGVEPGEFERQITALDRRLADPTLPSDERGRLEPERARLTDPEVVAGRIRGRQSALAARIRNATIDYQARALPMLLSEALQRLLGPLPPDVDMGILTEGLALATDENADLALVQRFFGLVADQGNLLEWPENEQWRTRVAHAFDVEAWIGGFDEPIAVTGHRYRCRTESDPLLALRMGSWFDTCLALDDFNRSSALTNVIEANRHVVYALDDENRVIGRKLIAVTDDGRLLGWRFYAHRPNPHLTAGVDEVIARFARRSGLQLGTEGVPSSLTGAYWYDDGIEEWTPLDDDVMVADHSTATEDPAGPGARSRGSKAGRRAGVVRRAEITPEIDRRLAVDTDPSVRQALALDPAAADQIVALLARDEEPDVRAAVATRPALDADVLDRLGSDSSSEVRQEVAQNLWTSPATLDRLAGDEDLCVRWHVLHHWAVPATALDTVADLQLAAVAERESRHPDVPAAVLLALHREADEKILSAVVRHDAVAPTTLARLAESPWAGIRRAVAADGRTPDETLRQLAEDPVAEVREAVAQREHLPAAVARRLATDPRSGVRELVAAHPDAPPSVLAELVDDGTPKIRSLVAKHPSAPATVLDALAETDDAAVKYALASNPCTPARVLRLLADSSAMVSSVAANPGAPPDLLDELAKNAGRVTASLLAHNPATPPQALSRFSQSPDRSIRLAVVVNAAAPGDVLQRLASDEHVLVRLAVAQHARTPATAIADLAEDLYDGVRAAVVRRPSTTSDELDRRALDPSPEVRAEVAQHPNTSGSTLLRIAAEHPEPLSVAQNPKTPPDALEKMAGSPWVHLRVRVAGHTGTPPAVLSRLARDPLRGVPDLPPREDQAQAEREADARLEEGEQVRRAAAANPRTPTDTLTFLARSPYRAIRLAVAANPSTPAETLMALSDELDPVRTAAVQNPAAPWRSGAASP